MKVKEYVKSLEGELIELRRDFHMHPELGFQEYRTSEIIADYLKGCGLEVQPMAKTGVVGILRGNKSGPTVMLRADMDALPIQEENDVPYKSVYPGKMHACGHDGHMAMLLVAAKILSSCENELNGNIKFVFQPNEEDAGALQMIEAGVMENPQVDIALGLHLWSSIASGEIAVSGGPIMAGHDNFRLNIRGEGGHSGSPHDSIDPIVVAANVIQSVQTIQTREIDVLKPTLIMFGKIEGGSAPNVIPEEVEILGSMRCLYESGASSKEQPKQRFERIVSGICAAHRTSYELEFVPSSSTLINDYELANMVKSVAKEVVGPSRVIPFVCMAGEDFAEYGRLVPSLFYFVGVSNKNKNTVYPHHHPCFNIDEDMLAVGVEMHVRTALEYIRNGCH